MNKVILHVDGLTDKEISVSGEPKCEADLLQYPAYKDYYYSVGLGAPVTATVTVRSGMFKSSNYSFNFTIKGNYMTLDQVTSVAQKYKNVSTCEHYNVTAEGIHQFLFSFTSNDQAFKMYSDLADRSNVGVNHGFAKNINKYVVVVEYNPV